MLTRHAGCPVLVGSKWGECISIYIPKQDLLKRLPMSMSVLNVYG